MVGKNELRDGNVGGSRGDEGDAEDAAENGAYPSLAIESAAIEIVIRDIETRIFSAQASFRTPRDCCWSMISHSACNMAIGSNEGAFELATRVSGDGAHDKPLRSIASDIEQRS